MSPALSLHQEVISSRFLSHWPWGAGASRNTGTDS
jgi:hypothetical protein